MATVTLGETTVPDPFDRQPKCLIFDPSGIISDAQQQLSPFYSIAQIVKSDTILDLVLQTKFEQTIILILILVKQTRDYVANFIDTHVSRQPSIHSLYLFSTDGHQYETALRTRYHPLRIECYSMTDRLFREIQEVLSIACDLNIKFCYRRANEEKNQGNCGLAFIYEQQRHARLVLQRTYNTSCINEIDEN